MRQPLAEAAERIGDRWTLLLVAALLEGPRRFGDLRSDVEGIAPNVLSARLKQLARDGVITARPYSRRPLRLVYELTGAGHRLADALRLLTHWGAAGGETGPPRHAACGTPMEVRWYCPTCTTIGDPEDADLRYL